MDVSIHDPARRAVVVGADRLCFQLGGASGYSISTSSSVRESRRRLKAHRRHPRPCRESQAHGGACLARRGSSVKILSHLGLPIRHLRYAVPASLAVRPALPVLAFAPPSPGAHLPRSPARSFDLPHPISPPIRFSSLSRQSPLASTLTRPHIASKCGASGQ